ncbi:MAG: Trk system potassium transporter TrkA [Oscillospiraceae bacterium]|nr:Trk system potassium transporter TrkA [Oscillospiraceae bacterium]
MNIIIAGNGKVGTTLVRLLTAEGHDLTLIDLNKNKLETTVEQYDAMAVEGNCASMPVLLEAGVRDADLLIATTGADEVNLLCCMTAHGLNQRLHTIARIRNPEYTEQIHKMRNLFALSMMFNPERQAAKEIERLLRFPGFLRRDTFAKGRAEIVELRIDEDSKLRDISLIEMYRTLRCRVLVCAVLRSGTAIVPGGSFVLREGDRIFVTAPTANLSELLKSLGIVTRRVKSVMIGGGDTVSYYLAQLLQKDRIRVRIMEKNSARCRELAAMLPDASVIQGDFSSRTELENAGLSGCDAFVSMSGLDEMNMITSLYAASRGVGQVITKLGRTSSTLLADDLELGSVICPRELCSNDIVRYVRAMGNQAGAAVSVHAIADGEAEAVEFLVDSTTRNCGIPLKELKLKPGVLLASITRGSQVEIPGGDSKMQPGDTVVVVTNRRGALLNLNDIFA